MGRGGRYDKGGTHWLAGLPSACTPCLAPWKSSVPGDPRRVPGECQDHVFADGFHEIRDKVSDFLSPMQGTRDQAGPAEMLPRMSQ